MKNTLKKMFSTTVSLCMLFASATFLSASGSFGGLNASAASTLAHTTEIGNVLSGQQAVFDAEVDYAGSGEVELKFSTVQLFHIKDTALTVGTKPNGGSYGKGKYKIQVVINPEQFILTVKVTLPDGGIITRGFPELLGGTVMNFYISGNSKVLKTSLHSEDYASLGYAITEGIPYPEDEIGGKIYNVVTSFNDASTTRNFAWTATTAFLGDSSMQLKYRKVGSTNWTVVDAVKEVEIAETEDEDYFKCDISGLTAGTEYEYKIGKKGGKEETEWTSSFTFKTADKKIDEFTFVAVGDTQGNENWYYHKFGMAALEQAFTEVENPAFILHTGDVVEDGLQMSWNLFFKSLNNLGASTPLFATVGNHDCWHINTPNTQPFYFGLHFNHPNNGGTAAYDQSLKYKVSAAHTSQFFGESGKETVYSFDYGNAHFIVLNSGAFNNANNKIIGQTLLAAQKEWLIKDLEANKDAKWKIVMYHGAAYSFYGSEHNCDFLSDVIEGYGVDLVIQGHNHLVSRTYPMKNGKIVTKAVDNLVNKGVGTIYTTIGAAKPAHSSFSNYKNYDETASLVVTPTNTQPTYTTVSINDSKIMVTVKQINGFVVDTFTIRDKSVPDIPFKNVTTNKKPTNDDTSSEEEDISSEDVSSVETESDNISSENTVVSDTTSENTSSSVANNSVQSDNSAKDDAKINPLLWLLLLIPVAGAAVLAFFLIKKKVKK